MKRVLLFSLLVCSLSGFAQQLPPILHGVIGIESGELFSYDVSLRSTDTPGFYRGTSATFLHEGKESISRITAVVDANAKTLLISEKEIIENRGFGSRATICLITANLAYEPTLKVLKGSLNSKTAGNGAACAKGTITLFNDFEIQPFLKAGSAPAAVLAKPEPVKEQVIEKPVNIVYDTASKVKPVTTAHTAPAVAQITAGKDEHIDWKSDTIVLSFWDNGVVDGDKVSIRYDGALVAEQKTLTQEKIFLRLPILAKGLHILSIEAVNEGSQAPNTCTMILQDGDLLHQVEANNTIGKAALLRINKL